MNKPHMNTATHRLTDLPGPKSPVHCQKCGMMKTAPTALTAWQEHDHHDKPEFKVVMLCGDCKKRIIEPHPRLYRALRPFHPWPGIMQLCLECKFREGVSCTHPNAKANGGQGVKITFPEPTRGFVDGGKYSGPVIFWAGHPTACEQREEVKGRPIL